MKLLLHRVMFACFILRQKAEFHLLLLPGAVS